MLLYATLATALVALSHAAPPLRDFHETYEELEAVANIPAPRHANIDYRQGDFPKLNSEDANIPIAPPNQLQDSNEQLETMANEPFSKTVLVNSPDTLASQKSAENNEEITSNKTTANPDVISSDIAEIIPESAITLLEEIVSGSLTQLMKGATSSPGGLKSTGPPASPDPDDSKSTTEIIADLLKMTGVRSYQQKIILKIVHNNDENNVLSNFLINILNNQLAIELEKREGMMLDKIKKMMFYHLHRIREMKMLFEIFAGNGQNESSSMKYFLNFPLSSFEDANKPVFTHRPLFNPPMPPSFFSSVKHELDQM